MADNDWFARQASRAASEMRSLPDWLRGDSPRRENHTHSAESSESNSSEDRTNLSSESCEHPRREPHK
jgi:hypothetical protein